MIQRLSRRLVFVEEISSMQNHVNIMIFRKGHNLVKRLPAILATMNVALIVANMAVCCYEYSNSVLSCII